MRLHSFELLNTHKDKISHAISSREAGNLAFYAGDRTDNVKKNRNLLAAKIGYKEEKAIYMNQNHSNKIEVIRQNHDRSYLLSCDGIITDQKGTALVVMVADCIPILFFDTVKNVIGAVHAGRSGLFKNIIKKAVECFKNEFKTSEKDLMAALGPSIQHCCYEVGKEISDEASNLGFGECISSRDGRFFLDNLKMAKKELLEAGIAKSNIEEMNICTGCSTEEFFSYRKENQKTGRFAGVITLL